MKLSFYFSTDALDLADATKDKKVPMTLTDEEMVTSSKLTRRTLLAGAGIALGTVALAGGVAATVAGAFHRPPNVAAQPPCGATGQPCCDEGPDCNDGNICIPTGGSSNVCIPCGGPNQPCCPDGQGNLTICRPGNRCDQGLCHLICGDPAQPCCPPNDTCTAGSVSPSAGANSAR